MTSYERSAAEGRAAAHETNTKYKMVQIVEHRRERVDGWSRDVFVGSCGHTMDAKYRMSFEQAKKQVGRRRRCQRCPADPPKPIPVDHCTYGIGTEFGERNCPTRARFNDADGYGLLCGRHHNYLLREGYLEAPAPRYQPPPGPVQYLPSTPLPRPTPELTPPRRGHLRVVR